MASNGSKKMLSLWIWVMIAYALLAVVALVLIRRHVSIDQKNQWNWGMIILSIELFHFGLSFKIVGPKELGAVLLFGRPLYQVKSGLVYVPFIICQIEKELKTVEPIQFPAEPERVDKSGIDEKPVTHGFLKPIRITTCNKEMLIPEFKERIKECLSDPLNDMMTLEPSVVVSFKIIDFIPFLTNAGSIKNIKTQMRYVIESVLNVEFPKRTPLLILLDKESINKELKEMIKKLVGEKPVTPEEEDRSWGINVISVMLAEIDTTKTVNTKLRDVVDSKLDKIINITIAEGKKQARILEGEGENKYKTEEGIGAANARRCLLEAEAEGLEQIAKVAETEQGRLAVISKIQEEAMKNAQYSIVPDSMNFISGIQEILKRTKSPDEDGEDENVKKKGAKGKK